MKQSKNMGGFQVCVRGFDRAPGEIYQLSSISTNRIQQALYTVVEEGQTREEGRGPRDQNSQQAQPSPGHTQTATGIAAARRTQ